MEEQEEIKQAQEVENAENVTNKQVSATEEIAQTESDAENKQNKGAEQAPAKEEKKVRAQKKDKKEKSKKVQEVESFEGLSDDEIYTKIETEKLLQRKKTKKIVTLCSLCAAFVVALVFIILAVVPVSLKPVCMGDDINYVMLYPGSQVNAKKIQEDDEKFGEFMKVYNKSFSETYLSAAFNGSFSYQMAENSQSISGVLGGMGELFANNTYFVHVHYAKENDEDKGRLLTYQNGTPYISRYSSSSWDGKLYFTDAYVVVNKEAGVQNTNVYFVVSRPDANQTSGESQYLVTVTLRADTFEIYNAWEKLTA